MTGEPTMRTRRLWMVLAVLAACEPGESSPVHAPRDAQAVRAPRPDGRAADEGLVSFRIEGFVKAMGIT